MANLFYPEGETWAVAELDGPVNIANGTIRSAGRVEAAPTRDVVLVMPRRTDAPPTRWFLLAPPGAGVQVNGLRFATGIRLLADRDAIGVAPRNVLYFSSERQPRAERYAAAGETHCPRCKLAVRSGDLVVRCPACEVIHHHAEQAESSCWTYGATCALCDQPTDMQPASLRWTPEQL